MARSDKNLDDDGRFEGLTKHELEEILAPSGSLHEMDDLMLRDNPDAYLKSYKLTPEEENIKVAQKISLWKRFIHFILYPFRQ